MPQAIDQHVVMPAEPKSKPQANFLLDPELKREVNEIAERHLHKRGHSVVIAAALLAFLEKSDYEQKKYLGMAKGILPGDYTSAIAGAKSTRDANAVDEVITVPRTNPQKSAPEQKKSHPSTREIQRERR